MMKSPRGKCMYQRGIQDFREYRHAEISKNELKPILAGEAMSYLASDRIRELAKRATPI